MPYAQALGTRIYYEEAGRGRPIVFVHEFAGDYRSWEDQIRYFSRGWRCVTLSARGYPKSDCPADTNQYGQDRFEADVLAVMDAAGVERAHVVGHSMGGYTTLMLGLKHPARVLSVVAAGAGSGAPLAVRDTFIAECRASADAFEKAGRIDAEAMGRSPTRIQLLNKDPRAWRHFADHLAEHSAIGSANTLRKVQAGRASLYALEKELAAMAAPTLLILGDEDEPCLDVNLWMKRLMPSAQMTVLPGTGHGLIHEEPALFNHLVERFIASVDLGQWRPRDPVARTRTISGVISRANERNG